jgi:hypothetical protein
VQASLARDEARAQWPLLIAAARAGSSADGYFSVEDAIVELGPGHMATNVEPALRSFAQPHDLLEILDGGELRFRFRYPGVSALLLMSAAMAQLAG